MTEIVTYRSVNAPAGKEWAAYINLGHEFLGIRFSGSTEDEARQRALEFWAKDQEKREKAQAGREAGRQKLRERKQKAA